MDDRIRCSYCLQELNDMRDPRQLKCSHIFCMACITSDCKQETGVKCPICQKVTEETDLDSLNKPTEEKLSSRSDVQVTEYNCTRCEDNTAAVSYCIECADLICDKHLQTHKDYFRASHTVIDVEIFASNASAYIQTPCREHKTSKVSQVCSKCLLMACLDCDPSQNCTKASANEDHIFYTLSRIAKDFKKEFDELLKGCADKVTEICKLEKETWLTLDSLIEKCQRMVEDVQRRTEEQISQIRESAQKLTQQIQDYQVDRTNRVQVFVSDLVVKREELEQLQKSVRHLVQNCSVVEKIQQKEEKTTALKEGKDMEIEPCDWEEMALMTSAAHRKIELILRRLPLLLTFNKEHKISSCNKCRAVAFSDNGQLLVAHSQYFDQYYKGTMDVKEKKRDMGGIILSLATVHNGEVLCLCRGGSIKTTLEPYVSSSTLLTVPNAIRIAVFNDDLFVLSKSSSADSLTKYNLKTRQTNQYSFNSTEVVSICCHPDGDVLAVSKQSGVLYKFRVDEEEKVLQQVWSCDGLAGAYAVCTDDNGWIYVAASESRIYVVSEGKICRSLTSSQLTECGNPEWADIAVYGDTLVAIQCGTWWFTTFSLKYK